MPILSSYNNDQNKLATSSFLDAEAKTSDLKYENKGHELNRLRPNKLDNYIGQEKLRKILRISINAAKKRQDLSSLGHILLYGPPGLGKTSCAYLLAQELGTNAHIFSAPALERPKDILGILMSVSEGDVVFIDEIHRLNKMTEELLYPALEDYQIDLSSGKGSSSRMMRLDINKFILVGATTKLGYISAPLRDRFIHVHRMEYYSTEELSKIVLQNSKTLSIGIAQDAALALAEAARGTPRIVNRLLRLVRDFAHHHGTETITKELTVAALQLYKIDRNGLDSMDRKILEVLLDKYNGGPAGLETIAALTSEDKTTIEDYYEPFLIQSGFLIKTQRGRMVTDKGKEYMGMITKPNT
jgi:Holliday junction DNA helicase RuvB